MRTYLRLRPVLTLFLCLLMIWAPQAEAGKVFRPKGQEVGRDVRSNELKVERRKESETATKSKDHKQVPKQAKKDAADIGRLDARLKEQGRDLSSREWQKLDILRTARLEKGFYGLGRVTRKIANEIGREWVGPDHRLMSDGKGLISRDGLRQYRFPAEKRNSALAETGVQANLESRYLTKDKWTNNGHLDIID